MPKRFASYIEPITRKLEGYDFTAMRFSESLDFEIERQLETADRKFHRTLSCIFLPSLVESVCRHGRARGADLRGQGAALRLPFQKIDPARGGELPWFPNLPVEKQDRGDWFVLFPNFAFEIFPDQVDVFIAWPRRLNNAVKRSRYILSAKPRRPKSIMLPGRISLKTGMISTTKTSALSNACKTVAAPMALTAAYCRLTGIRCSSTTRNWLPNLSAPAPSYLGPLQVPGIRLVDSGHDLPGFH